MLVFGNICVARVALDIGIKLANASGDLLVSYVDARVACLSDQICRCGHELCGDASNQ
jgi:hypothetical protein